MTTLNKKKVVLYCILKVFLYLKGKLPLGLVLLYRYCHLTLKNIFSGQFCYCFCYCFYFYFSLLISDIFKNNLRSFITFQYSISPFCCSKMLFLLYNSFVKTNVTNLLSLLTQKYKRMQGSPLKGFSS